MSRERISALWNFSDPAGTETKFRELLADPDFKSGTPAHSELMTQIARTLGLQRKFDDARRLLAENSPVGEIAAIRWHLERGRTANSSKSGDRGRADFLKAYELANALPEENLALDAAHMMGIIETPDEALAWSLRSIERAERTADEKATGWLGPLYNNTGWTYHDRGDFARAMELFQKSLQFRISKQQPTEIRIARWTIARCLRSMGKLEEALAAQRELEAAGAPDGYVHEEIGECLLALKRADEARPFFAKAFAALSKDAWLVANEASRLERLRANGEALSAPL